MKWFFGILFTLVLIIFLLVVSITLPPVQNRLIYLAKTIVEKELGLRMDIGAVDFGLFNWAILRDVVVYDKQNNVFLSAKSVELEVIKFSFRNLYEHKDSLQTLSIGRIDLKKPNVYIYKNCDGKMNTADLITTKKDTTKSSAPLRIDIDVPEIFIENGTFTYRDSTQDAVSRFLPRRMNFANFQLSHINLLTDAKRYDSRRIDLNIKRLSLQETYSGLVLNKLSVHVISDPEAVYDKQGICIVDGIIKLNNLVVESGNTHVAANIRFPDNTIETLLSNKNRVNYQGVLNKSSFEFKFLDYFTDTLPTRGLIRSVEGEFVGDLEDLYVKNVHAVYDEELIVDADVNVYHFLHPEDLSLDIKMKNGRISGNSLFRLLPGVELPPFFHNIPTSLVVANFTGKPLDFQVAGTIESTLGYIQTDLHILLPPKVPGKDVSYEGTVYTRHFQLNNANITPDLRVSNDISFNGKIKGQGGNFDKLEIDAETNVNGLEVVGYTADSVYGNLKIRNQRIAGYVRAHDGITHYIGNIDIDLANTAIPKYKIDGEAKNVNLKKYKVLDQEILVSGIVNIDMQGKDANTISGIGHIKDAVVTYQGATNFRGNVDVDITDNSNPKYTVVGKATDLNLKKFKLIEQEIIISSDVNIDLQGKEVETITGTASLKQMVLTLVAPDTTKTLKVSDIFLTAEHPNIDSARFTLRSSLGNADIAGHFKIMKTIDDVKNLATELQMYFTNNDSAIQAYYYRKPLDHETRSLYLLATAGPELNRLFSFLVQPIYVADSSVLRVDMDFGESNALNLHFKGDSVVYDSIEISKPIVALNLLKYSSKNVVLLNGTAESPWLGLPSDLTLENTSVSLNAFGTDADIFVHTEQRADTTMNTLNLHAIAKYSLDGHVITTLDTAQTKVKYEGYNWRIRGNNRIRYYNGTVDLDTLRILTDSIRLAADKKLGRQSLAVVGTVSKNPEDKLTVIARNFDLPILSNLYGLDFELNGKANVQVDLYDLYQTPKIVANGLVQQIGINGLHYGDLYIDGRLRNFNDKLLLTSLLVREGDTLLSLKGTYDFANKTNPLDFRLSTETSALPLEFLNPFVEQVVYDLKGTLQLQQLSITGSTQNLIIVGAGKFINAEFGLEFSKTKYSFNGDIVFDRDLITIKKLLLYDQNKHTAEFYGNIRHKSFKQFDIDLQLENIRDFLLVNLKKGENTSFYGQIYIKEGLASITGDLEQLSITAYGVTGKNTLLQLPLYEGNTITTPEYISFLTDKENTPLTSNGVKLDLNITIVATQEAEVELIFDEKIGDIMRGSGNGTLTLTVNPQGDFMMYGSYEIVEGAYLFTTQNLINKDFKVKPGGDIIWDGDPTEAEMNITAYYEIKNANAKALLNYENNIYVKTNVIMHLEGPLMQPTITPDIEFPDLEHSGASAQIANELNAKKKSFEFDEQELNKQVISLLLWNQFAPNSLVDVGGSNNLNNLATTSISEFISNQVNFLLAKNISDKVAVSFSTSNMQDVNLAISAKLFNDRVTIERDGAVVSNNTNLSIGNINVVTKLLPSAKDSAALNDRRAGELTLDVFNRNSIGTQVTNGNQIGTGIFYKRDFDALSDIFGWKKKRLKVKAEKDKNKSNSN